MDTALLEDVMDGKRPLITADSHHHHPAGKVDHAVGSSRSTKKGARLCVPRITIF